MPRGNGTFYTRSSKSVGAMQSNSVRKRRFSMNS